MPPHRRAADRASVQALGWMGSLALSGSLAYMFVRTLRADGRGVDPLFLGMQMLASTLLLVYSMKTGSRVFTVANAFALANVIGTLLLFFLR